MSLTGIIQALAAESMTDPGSFTFVICWLTTKIAGTSLIFRVPPVTLYESRSLVQCMEFVVKH